LLAEAAAGGRRIGHRPRGANARIKPILHAPMLDAPVSNAKFLNLVRHRRWIAATS